MTDKNRVKTIVLSNNDRFYFSWKYDEELIEEKIREAQNLYYSFREIPILPQVASQIEDDIIIKSIHGTAAIEGNPLSENDVQKIIAQDNNKKVEKRAEQEVINLKVLYQFLREKEKLYPLSYARILAFHEILLSDIEYSHSIAGKIRSHVVRVGDASHGGIYKPPLRTADIKLLLNEFITLVNSEEIKELDPIIRGAITHYHLALIHPFEDGNGRTARFLEAYTIRSFGIKYIPALLSNYYYRHMDDYYWAFSRSEKDKTHNITPFLVFVYNGVIESLQDVKDTIYVFIRILTLRNQYTSLRTQLQITQRQHDLLMALTKLPQTFTLQELYTNPVFSIIYRSASERTAQRDLKKLVTMELLKKHEDGTYEINLRALG